MKTTRLKTMRDDAVFVFGSNEGGIHGAGAARYAFEHRGAKWGLAFGLEGRSFAIPTKDARIKNTLPLIKIKNYVDSFLWAARGLNPIHPDLDKKEFQVTRIGCGLAGLKDEDVAPMFIGAPDNCWFDTAWKPWLGEEANYWGTF